MKSIFTLTLLISLVLSLVCLSSASAQNRVVVVPMFGPDSEIIFGTDFYTPQLAAQRTEFTEQITSQRSGYWMVNKTVAFLDLHCTGAAMFYVQIDNVPINSSMQYTTDSELINGTLTGISETVITAGTHEVEIGMQCTSGTASNHGKIVAGRSTVIVIPR